MAANIEPGEHAPVDGIFTLVVQNLVQVSATCTNKCVEILGINCSAAAFTGKEHRVQHYRAGH